MKAKIILILMSLVALPKIVSAQATQFYIEDTVGGSLKAHIYVAADTAAKSQVQESLYKAIDHARDALSKLDAGNPGSELSQINQKQTSGHYTVSPELANAISVGLEISKKSGGFFDITSGSKEGSYRDVKMDTGGNKLQIQQNNITIDLSYMLNGFLADLIAEDLVTAGWKNALVKVDDAYVASGNDISEPWKIPVVMPTNSSAKRELLYRATDVAAATWSGKKLGEIINPKTKSVATSDLKSITIFTPGAAKAQGFAAAVSCMSREDARIFILRHSLRAVLGEADGKLTNIPEFKTEGEKTK